MKKGKEKLTLSVDKKTKEAYKKFCEEHGLQIGKQIELFMQRELEKQKEKEDAAWNKTQYVL